MTTRVTPEPKPSGSGTPTGYGVGARPVPSCVCPRVPSRLPRAVARRQQVLPHLQDGDRRPSCRPTLNPKL